MRIVRVCLAVAVASVALLGGRSARAMCSSPSSGFSPPTGTVLPASAAVYLFVVKEGFEAPPAIRLEVEGARFTARRVATMPVYDVVRIDLAASSEKVVIRWKPENAYDAAEVRYAIGAVAPGEAQVTGVSHSRSAWSCSHTDTIDVALTSSAIAYRLDWSDGTSEVIPAGVDVLWRSSGRDDAARSSHRLAIGYVSCLGDTVDPEALATLRTFRLAALFADGSERGFDPAHARLDGDAIRLPQELLPARTVEGRPSQPQESPARPVVVRAVPAEPSADPPGPVWPMIGALAALAGLVVAGRRARRRRVHGHVPWY